MRLDSAVARMQGGCAGTYTDATVEGVVVLDVRGLKIRFVLGDP